LPRNVELEGPFKIYGDPENRDVFVVWFDCDCGERMAVHASQVGPFEIQYPPNPSWPQGHKFVVWRLAINGDRLSVTPSILFGSHKRSPTCHLYVTNEQFRKYGENGTPA
jgi:hypothetical protein